MLLQSLLCLIEQPYVLDGNNGLTGESLQVLDLMLREGPGLGENDHDHPNALPSVERLVELSTVSQGLSS